MVCFPFMHSYCISDSCRQLFLCLAHNKFTNVLMTTHPAQRPMLTLKKKKLAPLYVGSPLPSLLCCTIHRFLPQCCLFFQRTATMYWPTTQLYTSVPVSTSNPLMLPHLTLVMALNGITDLCKMPNPALTPEPATLSILPMHPTKVAPATPEAFTLRMITAPASMPAVSYHGTAPDLIEATPSSSINLMYPKRSDHAGISPNTWCIKCRQWPCCPWPMNGETDAQHPWIKTYVSCAMP